MSLIPPPQRLDPPAAARTQQSAPVPTGGQEDGPALPHLPRGCEVHRAEADGVKGKRLVVGNPDALRGVEVVQVWTRHTCGIQQQSSGIPP